MVRAESGLVVSPWRTKASCSITKAASHIPTVMPQGQMTSSMCRFVLGAMLQGRLTGTLLLTSTLCGGHVRVSLVRGLWQPVQRAWGAGGELQHPFLLAFLVFLLWLWLLLSFLWVAEYRRVTPLVGNEPPCPGLLVPSVKQKAGSFLMRAQCFVCPQSLKLRLR